MLDYQLFQLLIATIEAAQPVFGIPLVGGQPGVPIYQKPQVTAQGTPTGPCGFITKVTDQRRGSPERFDYWDQDAGLERHGYRQWYRSTYQFDALATQDPAAVVQYSAADIVNLHSALMQSDIMIDALRAEEVGIERISDIRNVPFTDDRDRFSLSPSFDFVLTHKQIVQTTVPV